MMIACQPAATCSLRTLMLCAWLMVGCGGLGRHTRGHDKPNVDQLLLDLVSRSDKAQSFMAESRMEYWANGQRVKPTVLVMGKRGARVRLNVLNPTGGNVAADLACNGADFQFIDFNRGCQLTGPCNKDSIGHLLGVSLEPDDFLLLAVGSTPLIDSATGAVKWNADKGQELLSLVSQDGQWKQEIVLDRHDQGWDVVSSTVWNADGKVEWKLTNKDFLRLVGEDQQTFRVPGRTRFEQPQIRAEVTIRWIERELNAELSDSKFIMQIPQLPRC